MQACPGRQRRHEDMFDRSVTGLKEPAGHGGIAELVVPFGHHEPAGQGDGVTVAGPQKYRAGQDVQRRAAGVGL